MSDEVDSFTQVQIAKKLPRGEGVEQNLTLVAEYFTRVSDAEYLRGMIEYGKYLCNGIGVTQDIESGSAH
jgi:TPR repeat protein